MTEPSHAPVPVPCAICSRDSRTSPVVASIQARCQETSPSWVPRTSTSYASLVPASRCQMTSSGVVVSAPWSASVAAACVARAASIDGVVLPISTGASWATDEPTTWPDSFARTTKSPPTTRRPSWVRS